VSDAHEHPQDFSLREQAARIASGDLDPAVLLEATLARIDEREGELNSTPLTFAPEAEAMLAAAPPGPLQGVPLTVKDMFSMPWHGARSATADALLPPGESGMYRRLRDGGAVVAGLANQHALGWGTTGHLSAYGAHGNPWDPRRSPGGSSGGSAAAVSARLVAGSVGSDSGGSARIPAAYCGVVGLKLTYGGVPRDGYTGAATSLSAWGALARDGADTRLLTEVLLGRPLERSGGAGLRVGIVRAPYWDDCDPAVVTSCEQAIAAAGWATEDIELSAGDLLPAAGIVRTMCELVPATPAHVLAAADPLVRAYALYARLWPAMLVARADRVRAQLRVDLVRAFERVDVIAWPTVPAPAPPLDAPAVELPSGTVPADAANVRQATAANLAGVPGISVPVAPHPSGLPLGLQLLAPWGAEAVLLDAAEHLEDATGRTFVDARPPLAR